MSHLSTHLAANGDRFSDVDLIMLTMLGRSFGRPTNVVLGSRPEDQLLSFLREQSPDDEEATAPFIELIAILMDDPLKTPEDTALGAVLRQLPQEELPNIAFRLIRIVELSGAKVPKVRLKALATAFSPGPKLAGSALSAYWQLVLSRFASRSIDDDEIPVCREMVLADAFIDGPLITTAGARPYLFFGAIVPIVFDALRLDKVKQKDILPGLREAMRVGFKSLYRDARVSARRQAQIKLLASQVEVLVNSGSFARVAEAVIDGAVMATHMVEKGFNTERRGRSRGMPFADLAELEAGYSRGRAQRQTLNGSAENGIKAILSEHVEQIRKALREAKANVADPILATNLIPYSEGVYFLIWQWLLQAAGLTIELKPVRWDRVIEQFVDGRLSFAVWNRYTPENPPTAEKLLLTREPLLTYRDYPLVVRKDALERMLNALPAASPDRRHVLAALTANREIPFDTFTACSGLIKVMRREAIGYVPDTEMEEIANTAIGKDFNGKRMSSDEAVGCIVDAKIAGAFLGGVQAHYLRSRFPQSTLSLTRVPSEVRVDLWFKQKTFKGRGYPLIVDPLLVAWNETRKVWLAAQSGTTPAEERRRLRQWIENLAFTLNHGVPGALENMRTPIVSWSELERLYELHDRLPSPAGVHAPGEITPAKALETGARNSPLQTQTFQGVSNDNATIAKRAARVSSDVAAASAKRARTPRSGSKSVD